MADIITGMANLGEGKQIPYKIYDKTDTDKLIKTKAGELERIARNYINTNNLREAQEHIDEEITELRIFFEGITDRTELVEERDDVEKLIPVVNSIILEGLNFWNHPRLERPEYQFKFPLLFSELEEKRPSFKRDKRVEICPVKNMKRFYFGRIHYSPTRLWSKFDTYELSAGSADRTYKGTILQDKSIAFYYSRSPILWVQEKPLIQRLETPSVELLHLQMGVFTEDVVGKEFFSNNRRYDSIEEVGSVYRDIQDKYIPCEEIFVHALHNLSFEQYVKSHPELGVDPNTLEGNMGWSLDPNVIKAQSILKSLSPQDAIDLFIENPLWIKE